MSETAIEYVNRMTKCINKCQYCEAETKPVKKDTSFERMDFWIFECPNAKGKNAFEHTRYTGSLYNTRVPRYVVLKALEIAAIHGVKETPLEIELFDKYFATFKNGLISTGNKYVIFETKTGKYLTGDNRLQLIEKAEEKFNSKNLVFGEIDG